MSPSTTTPRRDDYDVVVVGARLSGAATAMLLARRGVRVALVDRAPLGRDTLSTHAMMRAGVTQLHRWGLLDRVIAAGTPPVRRTVFRYGDAATTVSGLSSTRARGPAARRHSSALSWNTREGDR